MASRAVDSGFDVLMSAIVINVPFFSADSVPATWGSVYRAGVLYQ